MLVFQQPVVLCEHFFLLILAHFAFQTVLVLPMLIVTVCGNGLEGGYLQNYTLSSVQGILWSCSTLNMDPEQVNSETAGVW